MHAGTPSSSSSELALARSRDRAFYVFNAALSVAALGFVAWILLLRRGEAASVDLRFLPAVNASFNAAAAACLTVGYAAIRRKNARLHKFMMVSAFVASCLFFVSYLVYHYVHGDTHYTGTGPMRVVYFVILATHILFSAAVVPLALTTLWLASRRAFARHRKIARITLPIWLYVSVTGVAIFFLLRAGA